jgi:LmbE family N-acetylglucosaminyl deacetylase
MVLEKNKNALLIVAHPDDETIWAGGLIMKNPQVNWTIFSLCRLNDHDRAPKFKKVCDFYQAKSIMTDLDDEGILTLEQTLPIIEELILNNISQKDHHYIITHGVNGEYRHPRHIGVHQAVDRLVKTGNLKPETVLYFNYKKISPKKPFSLLTYRNQSDFILNLSNEELEKKKKVMVDLYGFTQDGIDTNYCTNPEAYVVVYLKRKHQI